MCIFNYKVLHNWGIWEMSKLLINEWNSWQQEEKHFWSSNLGVSGHDMARQESLADAKVSTRQQCMYEGP